MQHRFLILAAVVAASPALAADRPLPRPTRDVEVEYRTTGMPAATIGPLGGPTTGPNTGTGGTMTIHYSVRTGRLRIEAPNGRGYAILDRQAHRMIMVMTQQHMYMEMPREVTNDPNFLSGLDGPDATFQKIGADTIAGIACTVYAASASGHSGQLCVSDDGVWLRAKGNEQNRAHEMEAIRVTYTPQSEAMFEPPADFQKMEMPVMPRGMTGGMPQGMPPGMPSGR